MTQLQPLTAPRTEALRRHARFLSIVSALAASMALSAPAQALDADLDEKDRLESCEKVFCETVNTKTPKNGAVTCDISKTWNRSKIKKGAKSKSLSWGFGDAKCKLSVNIPRKQLINALTAKKSKVFLPPHVIKCDVEMEDGIKPVRVTLAPKLKFKKGRAKKVQIELKKVDAPTMLKGLIWSTVKLNDSLGVFQGEIVDEINDFLHNKCPKRHG